MQKEFLAAIVIGLLVGSLLTFGVYRARRSLTTPNPADTNPIATTQPDDQSDQPLDTNLLIRQPVNESIVSEPQLTVTGETRPEAFVVIVQDDQSFFTTADQTGNFSLSLELADGINPLTILTVTSQGDTFREVVTVSYLPSEDDVLSTLTTPTPKPTESSPTDTNETP